MFSFRFRLLYIGISFRLVCVFMFVLFRFVCCLCRVNQGGSAPIRFNLSTKRTNTGAVKPGVSDGGKSEISEMSTDMPFSYKSYSGGSNSGRDEEDDKVIKHTAAQQYVKLGTP